MGLRARIFVLFGGVIALLIGAQWWLVTSLRTDLRAESAQAALEVGSSVLGAIATRITPAIPLRPATPNPGANPVSGTALEVAVEPVSAGHEDEGLRATVRIAGEPEAGTAASVPMRALIPATMTEPSEPGVFPRRHLIPVPTARVDALGREFQWRVLIGSLVVLALGLLIAGWLAHRVTAPMRALAAAATEIGAGRFGTEAPRVGEPRLDATIDAFNKMSHRLAELDAQARAAQAREHLTEIGEIARGIAHSLRNPLHVVGLTLAELSDEHTPGLARSHLATTARTQLERIDRTLRSFLQMSAGALGTPESVDAYGVAQDVALEAMQLAGGGVRIELAACAVPPSLDGNAAEIRTALHVLVVNAVEASSPAGTVSIGVEALEDGVRFVVEDDGPGLPDTVRARLFQPHVTTKEQGAGFGLFLAERIASRRYRGRLELLDRSSRGTRAELTLRSVPGDRDG